MGKHSIKYFSLVILLMAVLSANAQEFGSNVLSTPLKKETDKQDTQKFKPDIRVTLGTSFSSYGPGFNTFGTFIAPEISMPVTEKFSIQVGMGYSSLFYNQPEETLFGNSPSQYGSLYVSGTYQVNEKLSIRGTGYKTFLLNPPPAENTQGTPDFSNQGVAFDVSYKVSEHFHINASFQYRQQNYPAYYYGCPSSGFGTPFNTNPAFGGFGRSPFGY
jgi:hypothetical protein